MILYETSYLQFNSAIKDWQFQTKSVTVDGVINSVKVYVKYQGEGTAYFDNIQLYSNSNIIKYRYDQNSGKLSYVLNGDNHIKEFEYQGGKFKKMTSPKGEIEVMYNSNGEVVETVTNNIHTSIVRFINGTHIEVRHGYDFFDPQPDDKWFTRTTMMSTDKQYITSIKDEFNNETVYDINRAIGRVTKIIDPNLNYTQMEYDSFGRIIKVEYIEAATSNLIIESYEYDDAGNIYKLMRQNHYYVFEYNVRGQIENVYVMGQTPHLTLSYVEEDGIDGETYYTGLVDNLAYANGFRATFKYNEYGQILSITYNEELTPRYQYEYDQRGRLTVLKDIYNSSIYFYSYNLFDNIAKITDESGNEILYSYDSDGQLNGYNYKVGDVSRSVLYLFNYETKTYDYKSFTLGTGTAAINYQYENDSLKRLKTIQLTYNTNVLLTKNIKYYDSEYTGANAPVNGNASPRIYQIEYYRAGYSNPIHQYIYDKNGNITEISIGIPYVGMLEKHQYTYDGFGRLVQENIFIAANNFSKTYTYSYSSQGNISTIKEYAYTENTPTGVPSAEKRMYYENSYWCDILTKIEYYQSGTKQYTQTLTYDAIGNLTKMEDSRSYYNNLNYTWQGRELTTISTYMKGLIYRYNDQGIRVYKKQSGTTSIESNYHLNGYQVLAETLNNETIYYTYDLDGTLFSMNYQGVE